MAYRSSLAALLAPLLLILLILPAFSKAKFQFFNNMFESQNPQQAQGKQNVASDSAWYQQVVENGMGLYTIAKLYSPSLPLSLFNCTEHMSHFLLVVCHSSWILADIGSPPAHCTHYLCPDTLACVHFPHHCPCPFPAVEDKIELGEGIAICASKGGYKAGEAARKIELARKGLL